jgi:hypothetical protein
MPPRCCKRSMNQGQFPRRVKISSLHSTTTITTIIMPGAGMGQWWSCALVVTIIITTTITTITKIAFPRWENENRALWVLFFCTLAAQGLTRFLHANRRHPRIKSEGMLRSKTLGLTGFLLGRAVKMPVGPVEHGVRRRGPLGPRR